jgi:uncharacterized protein YndB with AHSA1/START domain
MTAAPATQTQELVIERDFDAPRELIFQVFTDPRHLRRWWGPKGYTCPAYTLDLRVGGRYHNCMRSPEGKDYWSAGTFREIVPNERLVYTDSFADADGNIVPGSYYGMGDDFPLEMLVTLTFTDLPNGRTRLTLRHSGMPAGRHGQLASQGWNESLDKLAVALTGRHPTMLTLPSDTSLALTRVYDAPRELVFRAYTDPQSYPHWWGPRGVTTRVDVMEPRPGGRWRFVTRDAEGREDAFRGEYREIVPNERIVATFEWEGLPGHISVETARFEEHNGGTRVITTSVFDSMADRDGMIQSGMEGGASQTYDRLAEYLQALPCPNPSPPSSPARRRWTPAWPRSTTRSRPKCRPCAKSSRASAPRSPSSGSGTRLRSAIAATW